MFHDFACQDEIERVFAVLQGFDCRHAIVDRKACVSGMILGSPNGTRDGINAQHRGTEPGERFRQQPPPQPASSTRRPVSG